MRILIVNADDFGHSKAVNAGVIEAYERGIVTSASLMVRREAATEAASYARSHRGLSIGLHLDLGEWTYRGEGWVALYEVDETTVEGDVARQLESFRWLVGRNPTHLDSHQHVHRQEPVRTLLLALGQKLGVPLRHFDSRVRYCGHFYGQAATGEPLPQLVTSAALSQLLVSLPDGITELCCHPGKGEVPGSSYGPERELELAALCDPRVRRTLEMAEIELRSFEGIL